MNRIQTLACSVIALALCQAAAPAAIISYSATLNGAKAATPNSSTAIGSVNHYFDTVLETMRIQLSFTGLAGTATAAHIHAATAVPNSGTAAAATQTPSFVGFPTGVTGGVMDQTWDLTLASTYTSAFVTASGGTVPLAEAALMSSVAAGTAYIDIHSSAFAGGEIRTFFAVPEPASLSLLGVAGMLVTRRRRSGAQ